MLTLGLSGSFSGEYTDLAPGTGAGFFHDATACLLRDGVLVAAVEEERLNRIKKTTKFPTNAVRECLAKIGAAPRDVDSVGYYFAESLVDRTLGELYIRHKHLPIAYAREMIVDQLTRSGLALTPDRIVFADHHTAHGASCFAGSGLDSALVVVMDGRGERHSSTIFHGTSQGLERLATYDVGKSLGYFYAAAISLLGYGLGDEYKIMGLAPYGDINVYADYFASCYELRENGEYTLRPISASLLGAGFRPRRQGEDFTAAHMDFAAGVQHTLEVIAMHVIGYWAGRTGLADLCFTGGVAHNSSLNGRLLRSGLFREIFVHPASHDAGAAEGAARVAARTLHGVRPGRARLRSAALGPDLGPAAVIEKEILAWRDLVDYETPADIVERAAALLADGAVIGWTQGPSEFGPRALGRRSILADPRPAHHKDKINSMVKMREAYRPFAPVVTADAAREYFDLPDTVADYGFMSFVVDVRESRRAELGAVTHIDGTARLQIVDPAENPRFHRLVQRFGEITGTPVLLNTSFNNDAEPIVQTVRDALTCFLTTELDYLILDGFVVSRRPAAELAIDDMILEFRPVTRLVRRYGPTGPGRCEVECEIHLDHAKGGRSTVTAPVFAMLERADGVRTVAQLAEPAGGVVPAIRREMFRLWQKRFFTLRPSDSGAPPRG